MTAERTAEEWGRLAVSLPGWRWMPGTLHLQIPAYNDCLTRRLDLGCEASPTQHEVWVSDASTDGDRTVPDPDDPATAGRLLSLLGSERDSLMLLPNGAGLFEWYNGEDWDEKSLPLGRACIAAAEALGRWPGGVG